MEIGKTVRIVKVPKIEPKDRPIPVVLPKREQADKPIPVEIPVRKPVKVP